MTSAPETTASKGTSGGASDIRSGHWSYRLAPAPVRPYLKLARIDRPIGTWLLLFPCWWGLSLALAAWGEWPDWRLLALFAAGSLIMRGAGCTYNDMVDRDYDGRVARTAGRPIPSGQISMTRAAVFLALQLLAGLAVLLQFNGFAVALGIASLALVFTYPFMKRITYWPQAWLGLTFNWGALLGWAAVTGALAWPPVLLYLAGLAWTLGYDTIYAHQDKEDDALIGVKSTALKLGAATRPWLVGFYALAVLLMLAAGTAAGLGWPFLAGVLGVALHFAWQVATLDIDDPANCLLRFRSNRFVGWILLAGIVAAGAPL
ncbi:MAG: 4-hydroxybenzoate octaprenyltransferase [Rhodospirillales bacterium]|nr:4-hydroxybenzoate octaprenyltransferase [Rhodospirillales bacterium]